MTDPAAYARYNNVGYCYVEILISLRHSGCEFLAQAFAVNLAFKFTITFLVYPKFNFIHRATRRRQILFS